MTELENQPPLTSRMNVNTSLEECQDVTVDFTFGKSASNRNYASVITTPTSTSSQSIPLNPLQCQTVSAHHSIRPSMDTTFTCLSSDEPDVLPETLTFDELACVVPGKKRWFRKETPGKNQFCRPVRRPDKVILQPLTGCMRPGELWAIMGPSGSGKSTFLNILANRINRKSFVRGKVCINGVELAPAVSKRFGYVMQDDVLYENLTVREVCF